MLTEEFYAAMMFEQMPPCDPSAPLRELHVFLNGDLLRIAEELGMDLSAACERALTDQVRRLLYEHWRRNSIESANGVEQSGIRHASQDDD